MSGGCLRAAATQGQLKRLLTLLEGGGNPCSPNEDGLTPLHLAVWNGHIDIVEALCAHEYGKNKDRQPQSCINQKTNGGFTALHLATMGGLNAKEIIEILLHAGADLDALDNLERTALRVAHDCERDFVEELLTNIDPNAEKYRDPEQILSYKAKLKEKHYIDMAGTQSKDKQRILPPECVLMEEMIGPQENVMIEGDTSFREPPRPKELKVDERRIKPSFDKSYVVPRRARAAKILSFLHHQSSINQERRRQLANVAETTEEDWRLMHPRAKPPEKELFIKNGRAYHEERKWQLVPMIEFSSSDTC